LNGLGNLNNVDRIYTYIGSKCGAEIIWLGIVIGKSSEHEHEERAP